MFNSSKKSLGQRNIVKQRAIRTTDHFGIGICNRLYRNWVTKQINDNSVIKDYMLSCNVCLGELFKVAFL